MNRGAVAAQPAMASFGPRLAALALFGATLAGAITGPVPVRGWIGVTLGEDHAHGAPAARIETVLQESPAIAAGLQNGDLVRRAGARTIHVARELTDSVRHARPGTTLVLGLERGGVMRDVSMVIGTRPPDLYRLLELDRGAWQEPARVLALLDLRSGAVVADIGAGGGYFTAQLATAVGPAGRVVAVDIDSDALEQLTTRFAGAKNVRVQRGLPADPRLDPDSFDAVLMVDAFHELEAPDQTLASVRRALRPGGRLVVVDRPAAAYVAGTHAIPEARVLALATAAGFELRARVDLQRQFALTLEPALTTPGNPR